MIDKVRKRTCPSAFSEEKGMPCGMVARAVLAFAAIALAVGLTAVVLGQHAFAQDADDVQGSQGEPVSQESQDVGALAGIWNPMYGNGYYSADGREVFLRACFDGSDASFDESMLDGRCEYEVTFGDGEETISYSGSEIERRVFGTGPDAFVCFDLVFDRKEPLCLSATFFYNGEAVCSWRSFQIVAPLTLEENLFVVDDDTMTATFANPVGPEGESNVSALANGDVEYYWLVNGARIEGSEHDPSVPGTHELWVEAASENVVNPAAGGLCLGTWTVVAPGEGAVPEEGQVDSGQDAGDASDQDQGQESAPSTTPDFPSIPTVPSVPVLPPAEDQGEKFQFKDVPEGAWFEDAVYDVAEDGTMLPYSETVFGVRDALTRGEAAQLVMRLLGGVPEDADAVSGEGMVSGSGEGEAGFASSFSDVDETCPYAEAIEWVRDRGIMGGYAGTDLFGPQDAITQEQLAVVLFNVRAWQGEVSSGALSEKSVNVILSHTQGAHRVSDWAKGAMAWALLRGWSERLAVDPRCPVTRGQAASIIYGARP